MNRARSKIEITRKSPRIISLATIVALSTTLFGCQGFVKESGPPPMPGGPSRSVLDCDGPLSIRVLRNDDSFGIDWSMVTQRLVFNKKNHGYYELFTSNPDGSDERSLTEGNPLLPHRHECSPVWSPDGTFIVFSAEKKNHSRSSNDAICGFGGYSDIWITTADGQRAWQLTNVPPDYDHGAMIPRLSRDGKKLLWTERIGAPSLFTTAQAFGSWILKVAALDFIDGVPQLSEIRSFQPGPRGFYEGADFTPDGRGILFTSSLATDNAWKSQEFVLDLATKNLVQLTDGAYNEHGRYTPDGTKIIYMSSKGVDLHGTDWWVMNADGSSARRLTSFEIKGNPQSSGTAVYPGTVAWDPTRKWFIGEIETSLLTQSYVRVSVTCASP